MASTYSALKVELIGTGEQSGTWGATTNNNLEFALSEAITGSANVDFATAADVTVTLTNTNTAQTARNLRLNITESSTGVGYVGNLILGSGCQIEKLYLINNATTGAKTIRNTTYSGVSVSTITFSTTTATATTGSSHGLITGQTIVMTGNTPAAYNGTFVVTVTGLTTFQYTMLSTPATNATVVGSYTSTGTGITVPAGTSMFVFNTGLNVVDVVSALNALSVGGALSVTGAASFAADASFNSTGAIKVPVGTTAQQPTGAVGKIRYNTTLSRYEGFNTGYPGSTVSTITFSTTTATATTLSNHGLTTGQIIVMSGCTPAAYNGTFAVNVVNSTTFEYTMLSTPATNATVVGSYTYGTYAVIGGGGATGGGVDQVFVQNQTTVTTSYTLTTGYNAESVGPITFNPGVAVIVPAGQRWVIL
jgi:hypothetical protein